MKYLSVVEFFFCDMPGGAARVAWDIATMMRDNGHSVTMLVYRQDDNQKSVEEYDGITVIRFDKKSKPTWHPGRFGAIVDSARDACGEYLSDIAWDIIHIHTPLIGLGVVDALGNKFSYLITVHSPIVYENEIVWKTQGLVGRLKMLLGKRVLKKAERKLLNHANKIHTLSQYTKQIIGDAYNVSDKVTVVPHWYEVKKTIVDKYEARRQLGWSQEKKIMFTVRGMRPRYGIDVAIKAASDVIAERGDTIFIIGGTGSLKKQFETLARELSPHGEIKFIGRLSDHDLELAYMAADVFILPTLSLECYGLITVEALSYGCPVLSSDAGAIPEIMKPVLPQCITPAGDVEQLKIKMRAFLRDELSIPDSKKLVAHVNSFYSSETVKKSLLKLIVNE